jgi:hypothetical protein
MRLNVVARGSLARSAAETRTGATAGCAGAISRPGWLDALHPATSTVAPTPARAAPAATVHRKRPDQNCRAARARSPSSAGPRTIRGNRPMRRK